MLFAGCPDAIPDAALWHAAAGRPVFPCYFRDQPDGRVKKAPLTAHGFHDATTDAAQITAWWSKWPEAGIGMPCGEKSGLMALDYDTGGGDVREVREEFHQRFNLPQAPLVASIRGGLHEYMRHAPGVGRKIHSIHPSVDILGEGGFVILPPSRMADGRGYRVLFDTDPCEATEELLAAIAGAAPNGAASGPQSAPGAVLDFSGAKAAHEYATLVAAAREPHRWHESAVKLTAHLLARGCPPDLILDMLTPALTQPGYTHADTRADLAVMVSGAMRKGWAPAAPAPPEPAPLFLTAADLLNLPPVEWMVEGYLPTQGMSALFAPPGAFKSFLALDMGLSVAYGLPWHGLATRQRKTLYVLAEGKHGFGQRARVWQEHRAGGRETDQFLVLPMPVNMLNPAVVDRLIAAIREQLGEVGFIILDTLARNFGPGDENSTKDMNAYVLGAAKLSEAFCAHTLHVHHTGKDEGKGERGSSALLGALDTSLKLVRDQGADAATLYVKKQKDGPEARPMRLSFPLAEGSHPTTGEVFHSRIPTLAGEPDEPFDKAGAGLSKMQNRLLDLIRVERKSRGALAAELGADSANVRRALTRLQERRLAFQDKDGFWAAWVRVNEEENQDDE